MPVFYLQNFEMEETNGVGTSTTKEEKNGESTK